jgi:hypothetical protein
MSTPIFRMAADSSHPRELSGSSRVARSLKVNRSTRSLPRRGHAGPPRTVQPHHWSAAEFNIAIELRVGGGRLYWLGRCSPCTWHGGAAARTPSRGYLKFNGSPRKQAGHYRRAVRGPPHGRTTGVRRRKHTGDKRSPSQAPRMYGVRSTERGTKADPATGSQPHKHHCNTYMGWLSHWDARWTVGRCTVCRFLPRADTALSNITIPAMEQISGARPSRLVRYGAGRGRPCADADKVPVTPSASKAAEPS